MSATRRRPPRRWRALLGLAAMLLLAPAARAQTSTSLTLERSDATIELVNQGRAESGARTVLSVPGCVPDAPVRTSVFYAPEGGVTARIAQADDAEDEATRVLAPLMTVLRPEGEGEENETLEAVDATATFEERPACLAEVAPAETPAVRLEQGLTTVVGGRFFLDRGTDVATMDGPVTLQRAPEGDGPAVEAEAEGLRFDLDADRSTLTGDVRVRAGERISRAAELELDEAAGVAILRGDPAVSREGDDEVRGSRLVYDLETNDVVVQGAVSASFEWEEGAAADEGGGDDAAAEDAAP